MSTEFHDAHNDILQSLSDSAFAAMDVDPDADTKAAFRAHLGIGLEGMAAPTAPPEHAQAQGAATVGEWLTVTQAATALGVSARAIQRRCKTGQLVARLVADKGGHHWEIGAGPDGLPLSAPTSNDRHDATRTTPTTIANDSRNDDRDAPNDKQTTPYEARAATPATAPTELTTGATQETTPATILNDAITSRYVAHLESEVTHLRGQVEAHARAEAELRAALREALKMSNRALTSGNDSTTDTAPPAQATESAEDAPGVAQSAPTTPTAGAQIEQEAGPLTAPWYPSRNKQSFWKWLIGG
jgi:hypothetical protein